MFKLKYRLHEEEPGDPPAEPSDPPASKWPEDWRQQYAGEDEKKVSQLERYASPEAAFDALFSAKEKIRAEGLRTPFPADGTDEEKIAWRKDQGLPEAPDKYDLSFEDGLVIGEDDKPWVDEFTKVAYESNMNPDQVKNSVQWYYQIQEKQAEEREAQDAALKETAEDTLRAEWGGEYTKNKNLVMSVLDGLPEETRDRFMDARLSDGTPVFSHPDMIKYFVSLAREVNPVTTLVPGASDPLSAIEDEIEQIETTMKTNRKKYNSDLKMQQRYRDLITARDKK